MDSSQKVKGPLKLLALPTLCWRICPGEAWVRTPSHSHDEHVSSDGNWTSHKDLNTPRSQEDRQTDIKPTLLPELVIPAGPYFHILGQRKESWSLGGTREARPRLEWFSVFWVLAASIGGGNTGPGTQEEGQGVAWKKRHGVGRVLERMAQRRGKRNEEGG